MEHLNPRGARVVALEKPSDCERGQWYLPALHPTSADPPQCVLFDQSWYIRRRQALMGFCSDDEYDEFMRQAPDFERMLTRDGIILFKFWFSVSRKDRSPASPSAGSTPSGSGRLSPMDLASLDRWHDYTAAKEAMFWYTDTEWAPWTVVRSNDKKRGRLEAMRWVLSKLDYPEKNIELVGTPDPVIVGPPADIYETEENTGRVFPAL